MVKICNEALNTKFQKDKKSVQPAKLHVDAASEDTSIPDG